MPQRGVISKWIKTEFSWAFSLSTSFAPHPRNPHPHFLKQLRVPVTCVPLGRPRLGDAGKEVTKIRPMAEFLAQRVGEASQAGVARWPLVAGREDGEGFEVLSEPKAGLLVGEERCSPMGAECARERGDDVCMPGSF